MKVHIDIITGFLDSGKTTFINQLLEDNVLSGERIAIIQYEAGETELDNELIKDKKVSIIKPGKDKPINSEYIIRIIEKHNPNRIIIEYNGMETLNALFEVLEEKAVRRKCILNTIVNIIDVASFEVFMNNMGTVFIEQITNSDLIVLNKTDGFPTDRLKGIEKTLKTLNKLAEIDKQSISDKKNTDLDNEKNISLISKKALKKQKLEDKVLYIFFCLTALYAMFSILRLIDLSLFKLGLSWLQTLNTVFLSILMQAFPFILIGIFVSSILQVMIPSESLVRIFPQTKGLGFIVAILAGVLFPVCDCAIVPVAARLIKKGVSIPIAITFMLSAPLVNPIVIASTLYAFSGTPSIAFYRVFFGVSVALVVGIIFLLFPEKKSILKNNLDNLTCNCEYCNEKIISKKGIDGKVQSIFMHASSEFFEVGKFLIIGAFLSSIFQTLFPKDIFINLWGQKALSLLVMMVAAFVFSVCSTSDAFIARTFLNQFSTRSIMGFLVLGPMIDIKNMLMLLSSFRKGFVIKLVVVIFVVAFGMIYLQTLFLM